MHSAYFETHFRDAMPNLTWPSTMALKSSDIIVVWNRTGRGIYEGPAGDEG